LPQAQVDRQVALTTPDRHAGHALPRVTAFR